MRIDIFLTSLAMIAAIIIWLVSLTLGILMIVRGVKRRNKEAKIKGWITIILGIIIGSLIFWPSMGYLYIERLWFKQMGYTSVFWKMTYSPWLLFLKYATIAGMFLAANFMISQWLCPIPGGFRRWATGKTGSVYYTMIVMIFIVAIIMGGIMVPFWEDFMKYQEREPFIDKNPASGELLSITDPQFDRDIGYFLFALPIYNVLSLWTKGLAWLTLLCMGILYNFYRHRDAQSRANTANRGIYHLSALWIFALITSIWRSVVNTHQLVYSQRGYIYGAGYTDVHIKIPAYQIYIAIVALIALAVAVNSRWKKRFLVTIPIVLWILSYVVLIWAIPIVYQKIWVEPNEAIREQNYIKRNIDYTRMGYGLHKARISEMVPEVATLEKIRSQPDTLKNVQLWDRRAVRDTLTQIQAFLPYYVFHDVDADRYYITDPVSGKTDYRQVMITARELDSKKLPQRTWVSVRMKYTHGYGLCLGPVNDFTDEGLPFLWVKGIPPETFYRGIENPIVPELAITQPQIYYGEVTEDYVFVRTDQPEFDHPVMEEAEVPGENGEPAEELTDEEVREAAKGENGYNYEGNGGIPLASIFRRCMLALRFWDFRIITSEHLEDDSRIMFNRQVEDRSMLIAPFLLYDKDPYIVIGDSGRLWWVIDAYVQSKRFPYSQPYRNNKFNYIRNPLKAVIDAYNGQVNFYIWSEDETVNKVYRKIFPGLFKSRKDMPDGLERHNRYPDDLTSIQAEMYCAYHMRDPQTFYGREDQWDMPYEVYHQRREEPMVPLYVMIRLPGDQQEEFISIMPFTPYPTRKYKPDDDPRPNMVAWMTVKNDEPNYGDMTIYVFPKGVTVPGPAQIESRIDTDAEISRNLTLWNEGGSEVLRGNLLTIPVGNALFYVEPLYLRTETIKMPILTQVIVAAGDEVAYAKDFDTAIEAVFKIGTRVETPSEEDTTEIWVPRSLVVVINSARSKFTEYRVQTANGNFEAADLAMEDLEKDLEDLEKYRDLLERKQSDILEELIINLAEAANKESAEAADEGSSEAADEASSEATEGTTE